MTASITIEDGQDWWAANWAYDAVVEQIAKQLFADPSQREFAAWLRERTCEINGPGVGYVDVRELAPADRLAFREAAKRAYKEALNTGPAGWFDPLAFPGWLASFERLLQMWEAIDPR